MKGGALHIWKHIYEKYSRIENLSGGDHGEFNVLSAGFLHGLHGLWARQFLEMKSECTRIGANWLV